MTEEKKMATLKEVKAYFEVTSSTQFAKEWKELTDADKDEFKMLVGEVIYG